MSLESYLKKLKGLIDKRIKVYLPSEKTTPKTINRAIEYSLFPGGKRIRPILAIESALLCGGSIREIMPAACAIEFIHTYSLIHDDLPAMDDDDYRRGKPTTHKAFGEANAILTGDALLTLAFGVISKNYRPDTGLEVVKELADAIGAKGMVGGQAMDMEYSGRAVKPDEKMLLDINRLKTAKLFEVSAKIGAIVTGTNQKKAERLAKFGSYLGMAFQIVDDIIDQEGYARVSGEAKARGYSKKLVMKARGILDIFGKDADRLRQIADYVLTRKR